MLPNRTPKQDKSVANRSRNIGKATVADSGRYPLGAEDRAIFRRLRVGDDLLREAGVFRTTSDAARQLGFHFRNREKADLAGVVFPYYELPTGKHTNARLRRDNPDIDKYGQARDNKYISMLAARRLLYWPPGANDLLKEPKTELMLVESEKAALAITAAARRNKKQIVAVAMGGCYGARERLSETESRWLSDLDHARNRDVVLCLDANVATNRDVAQAEKVLACYLLTEVRARSVRCVRLPDQECVNGPDDYLEWHTDEEFWALMDKARPPWEYGNTFASFEQLVNAPEPTFLIRSVLQDQGATFIGGLSGHGKSLLLASIMRALLTGKQLFGYFPVERQVHRILYLSPEVLDGQVRKRFELFGLMDHVKRGHLLVRTLSNGPAPGLDEPDILMAARGSVVVLDTAVRFSTGKESAAEDNRDGLSARCFALLGAGAQLVLAAHHSPKSFEKEGYMTLENVFRGSGDIGAMLSGAWGVRQLDPVKNIIHVENLKPRDSDPFAPFQVQGRPAIDTQHDFEMLKPPGSCGYLADELPNGHGRAGHPPDPEKQAKLEFLVQQLQSGVRGSRQLAAALNEQFGTEHKDGVIRKWLKEIKDAAAFDKRMEQKTGAAIAERRAAARPEPN